MGATAVSSFLWDCNQYVWLAANVKILSDRFRYKWFRCVRVFHVCSWVGYAKYSEITIKMYQYIRQKRERKQQHNTKSQGDAFKRVDLKVLGPSTYSYLWCTAKRKYYHHNIFFVVMKVMMLTVYWHTLNCVYHNIGIFCAKEWPFDSEMRNSIEWGICDKIRIDRLNIGIRMNKYLFSSYRYCWIWFYNSLTG